MKPITYLKGDVRNSTVQGNKILAHVCNNCGAYGKGVALAIKEKWPIACNEYKKWANSKSSNRPFQLGQVQFVKVEKDLVVANMIGQHGLGIQNGIPPIRYEAIDECLKKVAEIALKYKAILISPRFGCGLAMGKWEEIEKLIVENLCKKDIEVYIYDLE